MGIPETRLLRAAIVLAEELNFSRAAERLHIDQSTLSRRIRDLESNLDVQLFERNRQWVVLTEAGRKAVEEARQAMSHIERMMVSARPGSGDDSEVLHIGRSTYTDPWLVSTILAVHLPMYPALRIQWSSNFSREIAQEVISSTLDLGLTTGLPENPKLTCLKLAEHPLYVAMSRTDRLAQLREARLSHLDNRVWVLFARHTSPHLYDTIRSEALVAGVGPSEVHGVMGAEEAVPLILEHSGLALLPQAEAWRVAADGITIRPLAEQNLHLVTSLAARAESKSRLVTEFVKATARKLESLKKPVQARLPLSA